MTWAATIERIAENPVPNGTRFATVLFSDGPRSFRREMKLAAGLSPAAIADALAVEVANLEAMDKLTVDLASLVGAEIRPGQPRPGTVKMWQARAALRHAGLFDTANTLIYGSGRAEWIEAWEYAPEISREAAMVNAMGQALNLSSDQIDDLFRQAATISV